MRGEIDAMLAEGGGGSYQRVSALKPPDQLPPHSLIHGRNQAHVDLRCEIDVNRFVGERGRRGGDFVGLQNVENGAQESVDLDHLVRAQSADPFADGLFGVDSAELIKHEPSWLAVNCDLGSKHVRVCSGRRWSDDDRRQA
jgi:hypothetical protein